MEPLSSLWLYIYVYLGTGGYLINFLNVLLVALPAAKTTSYPTNRTPEKPFAVGFKELLGCKLLYVAVLV